MADSDNADILFFAAEKLANGFSLSADRACGSFLNKQIAVFAVFEGKQNKIDRFVQRHDESRHLRLGKRDGLSVFYLFDPERYYAAAAAHYVAVTRTANLGFAAVSGLRHRDFFLNRLGDAHCVDGVCGFVRRKADNRLHALFDSGG